MSRRYTVLTGGVGGAKLVEGLYRLLPTGSLTAIVNTGDDFRHLGLHVSPDIDTLLYTLSGRANRTLGWGREDESWNFMAAVQSLGGPGWFNLGDADLALHVLRTHALAAGQALTEIISGFAKAWALDLAVLPMCDDPVETWIDTDEGPLAFQTYFVARRCEPQAHALRFVGADVAAPGADVLAALAASDAIFIAPSNPYLSVDPILALPAIRQALVAAVAPVVAVSPLVGGAAVKGPTAKLMAELGSPVSNAAVALHYGDFLDGLVVHGQDVAPDDLVRIARTDTMMRTAADRRRVAEVALALAESLRA